MVQKNLDLYNLINNLNTKIKKLDIYRNKISKTLSFKIFYNNKLNNSNKKYIGLSFSENLEIDFDSINSTNTILFIKLSKNNYLINYSIVFEITSLINKETICSLALGIKDKKTSKIRIIKGSKIFFDINNKSIIINNSININNTIIYFCNTDEELCMIAEINDQIKICSKKSIIKILAV